MKQRLEELKKALEVVSISLAHLEDLESVDLEKTQNLADSIWELVCKLKIFERALECERERVLMDSIAESIEKKIDAFLNSSVVQSSIVQSSDEDEIEPEVEPEALSFNIAVEEFNEQENIDNTESVEEPIEDLPEPDVVEEDVTEPEVVGGDVEEPEVIKEEPGFIEPAPASVVEEPVVEEPESAPEPMETIVIDTNEPEVILGDYIDDLPEATPEPTTPEPTIQEPTVPEPTVPEPIAQEPTIQEPEIREPEVLVPVLELEPTIVVPEEVKPRVVVTTPVQKREVLQEPSIWDALYQSHPQTVSEALEANVSRKPLTELMTINDRFLIKRELFNNNEELFKKTISALDECVDFDGVIDYISENFPDWDSSNDGSQRLLELLELRLKR